MTFKLGSSCKGVEKIEILIGSVADFKWFLKNILQCIRMKLNSFIMK